MKKTDTTGTMFSRPISVSTTGLRPWPKSGRKPLQPKNDNTSSKILVPSVKPLPGQDIIPDPSNKENLPLSKFDVKIINIEPFEASLAEELSEVKRKMERLKLDKDKTENLLKERGLMLDMQMNQLKVKGEAQKRLENQVDRLFRLNQLRLSCFNISPILSLREQEEKKIKQDEVPGNRCSNVGQTEDSIM